MVPSQLVAIRIWPFESQVKSRIESSNKSWITTSGRFNEVNQTDIERSRDPMAQQGVAVDDSSARTDATSSFDFGL